MQTLRGFLAALAVGLAATIVIVAPGALLSWVGGRRARTPEAR